jgi:hypothetical protein
LPIALVLVRAASSCFSRSRWIMNVCDNSSGTRELIKYSRFSIVRLIFSIRLSSRVTQFSPDLKDSPTAGVGLGPYEPS